MYYNQKIEQMPREELTRLQTERLQWTVKHIYENVTYMRARMDEHNVSPLDIKSLDDLAKLPFMVKQDLRDTYPYGLFAVPTSDIVRLHASSGTTGKQIVVGYTQNDLQMWAESMARAFAAAGCTKDDFVQVCYGYGLFTGGLGAHDGAQLLGATVVPASTGNTPRQIQMLQDFGTTVLCCTPSYALYLIDALRDAGVSLDKLKLKAGIFGAEPWTEEMRGKIETGLGLKAMDIFGMTEVCGPGVSFDCECQQGLHINEDFFYPEIIDPDTFEVLPDGQEGELVFTSLSKEAFPLLRYRTRDIASLTHEKCACGRTLVRMSKPRGRTDDMLIIRGVNVFPSQIESVMLTIEGLEPHYTIIVDRVNNTDTIELQLELSPKLVQSGAVKEIQALEKKLKAKLDSVLGIQAKITFVEPKTLTRTEGKAKHVIDKRII
jgi:Coenzyme F390 synthetase